MRSPRPTPDPKPVLTVPGSEHALALRQVEEPGEQLASGETAGGAEQDGHMVIRHRTGWCGWTGVGYWPRRPGRPSPLAARKGGPGKGGRRAIGSTGTDGPAGVRDRAGDVGVRR